MSHLPPDASSNDRRDPHSPHPGEGHAPIDARSAEERVADESVGALFREAGLALSNGHAPALQGADARARAAEDEAIAAIFQSADCLMDKPGPDFRRMAVKAREIAAERGELGPEEELEGERVRSDLQQLPDLEVRCWNVSHTTSLPIETATGPAAPAPATVSARMVAKAASVRTLPVAPLAAAPEAVVLPVAEVEPAAAPLAPVAEGLNAVDAANIRENNWAEFKRRYHRERRVRILEMTAAGGFGAAACLLLIWTVGGFGAQHQHLPAAIGTAETGPLPTIAAQVEHGPATASNTAERSSRDADANTHIVPLVRDAAMGHEQTDWLAKNRGLFGVTVPDDVQEVGSPAQILMTKSEFDPNPARKLQGPWSPPTRPGDNVPPDLFPEAGQGLRIIRLSPRSDYAQAVLGVNDWLIRVVKPDGSTIELGDGTQQSLQAWNRFLADQHAGNSFDVEFQRGPLIRRTTVTLTGDK